jgi:hypothetical protein
VTDETCVKKVSVVQCVLMLALAVAGVSSATAEPFLPGLAGFSVRLQGEINPYEILGVYVLPGELLDLEILDTDSPESFQLSSARGTVLRTGVRSWRWKAPPVAGLYRLEIASDAAHMTLNVFVMVPLDRVREGSLNGYRIGEYPDKPLRGLQIYEPPRGFVEMTPENENTRISPHFRLVQFKCKQDGGPPRYVILEERLLLKLERVLAEVNERGYASDTLHVMSGYRTPQYNAAIRNVRYSRHQWGDGVDIFVDADPEDGILDDLDGSGKVDFEDARLLYSIIDEMGDGENGQGGLAPYPATSAHGPFVHLDVRGYRARWKR